MIVENKLMSHSFTGGKQFSRISNVNPNIKKEKSFRQMISFYFLPKMLKSRVQNAFTPEMVERLIYYIDLSFIRGFLICNQCLVDFAFAFGSLCEVFLKWKIFSSLFFAFTRRSSVTFLSSLW
jgi:hypothetical protein